MIDLINPDRIHNLEDYCSGSKGDIRLCYGLDKDYCPMTCSYAQKITNDAITFDESQLGVGAMMVVPRDGTSKLEKISQIKPNS